MWERENNDRHPLLDKNDTFEKARLFAYLYSDNHERREKAFSVNLSLKLRIGKPKPKKYLMVDHHSLPQPVVSKRIKDLVELLLQIEYIGFLLKLIRIKKYIIILL